jgi:hypothetical protein
VGYLAKAAKNVPALEPLHHQPDVGVGLAVLAGVFGVKLFLQRRHKHLGGE